MPEKLRQLENISNVDYDPARKTIFFAQDQNNQNNILQKNQDVGLTLDAFGQTLGNFKFNLDPYRRKYNNGVWSSVATLSFNPKTVSWVNSPALAALWKDACQAALDRMPPNTDGTMYLSLLWKTTGVSIPEDTYVDMRWYVNGLLFRNTDFAFIDNGTIYTTWEADVNELRNIVNSNSFTVQLRGYSANPNRTVVAYDPAELEMTPYF